VCFAAVFALACINPAILSAKQESGEPRSVQEPQNSTPAETDPNSRIFGVLPNYRTTDGNAPYAKIDPRRKLTIAAKDSFDLPNFAVTGVWALIYQAENQNPGFGQGLKGYGKRYAASYSDLSIGDLMSEGFLPIILHEDPRYFREGDGGTLSRIGGALRQIIIGRRDSGKWGLNEAEIFGGAITVGISNLYYTDTRNTSANVQRFGFQLGNDAISNVLKEFWPDIQRRFFQRHPVEQRPSSSD